MPQSKALYPLFEAISNSIDAIEEHGNTVEGEIFITFQRDPQDLMEEDTEENRERLPIRHITIKDNGVGFTPKNYEAFSELSSAQKKEKGGKGLGRVSWLKVFQKAEIKSIYHQNGSVEYLSFEFLCEDEPVRELERQSKANDVNISTEIKLISCKNEYIESIPKRRITIGEEIITHFLPYFMVTNVPEIILQEEGLDDINLNLVFDGYISERGQRKSFQLKGHKFYVMHAKTRYHSQRNKDHRVYYIANGRVVESEIVSQEKVGNIPPKIEVDNEDHVYVGYIESQYLNNHVNQARDSFNIPKKIPESELFDTLDWETIQSKIYSSTADYLHDYLEEARKQKDEEIRDYINKKAPNYSYIYNDHKKELDRISFGDIRRGKLERELHHIHVSLRSRLKDEIEEVLSIPDGEISPEEYKARLSGLVEKFNPTGKADLAEYIMHRKIVLELLNDALKKKSDGKFSKEDVIHNYIFPIKSSSDEITYREHNLWLLDERLSFNTYIASDISIARIPGFEKTDGVDRKKRMDLFAYAYATVEPEETRSPYKSVDIFEFKRPMRDDYSDKENPYNQVKDYLEIIRNQKAENKDGRNFTVVAGGLINCHIVCDITPNLRDLLDKDDFERIGNEDWYIKFHNKYDAIIEVQSFNYVLDIALKRNRILFEKLGL